MCLTEISCVRMKSSPQASFFFFLQPDPCNHQLWQLTLFFTYVQRTVKLKLPGEATKVVLSSCGVVLVGFCCRSFYSWGNGNLSWFLDTTTNNMSFYPESFVSLEVTGTIADTQLYIALGSSRQLLTSAIMSEDFHVGESQKGISPESF